MTRSFDAWSLRARLLAASLALLTVGLLAADVAMYRALRSSLYDRLDGQVRRAAATLEESLAASGRASVEQLNALVPGAFVQIAFGGQVQTATSPRVGATELTRPVLPTTLKAGKVVTVPSLDRGEAGYRVVAFEVRDANVIVGLPLDDVRATLSRLVAIEVVVTLVVLGLAAAVGVWLVRLGLRPLADIEATASAITAGDTAVRVPVGEAAAATEVGQVGAALNTMLDSLNTALGAARSSEERMRRFVADASHELRTPVAAVRAYAELYRRGGDERPEDLARILSRIEAEAERMGVLVEDLLLLTRLDEGRPLQSEPVDLGALADEAVEAARVVDPERDWALGVSGSVEVRGDRDRLRQVLDNLLANVRAHTPPGSPASVRVAAVDGWAVVEVADRGPGIPADELDKVFERFYRADPSRSRDAGGAGLGLSLVAAIVRAHGGTVAAETLVSGGALFRVTLPLLA